jgi:hypothetical protein
MIEFKAKGGEPSIKIHSPFNEKSTVAGVLSTGV